MTVCLAKSSQQRVLSHQHRARRCARVLQVSQSQISSCLIVLPRKVPSLIASGRIPWGMSVYFQMPLRTTCPLRQSISERIRCLPSRFLWTNASATSSSQCRAMRLSFMEDRVLLISKCSFHQSLRGSIRSLLFMEPSLRSTSNAWEMSSLNQLEPLSTWKVSLQDAVMWSPASRSQSMPAMSAVSRSIRLLTLVSSHQRSSVHLEDASKIKLRECW